MRKTEVNVDIKPVKKMNLVSSEQSKPNPPAEEQHPAPNNGVNVQRRLKSFLFLSLHAVQNYDKNIKSNVWPRKHDRIPVTNCSVS